jgi:hypothetical protein
MAASVSDKLWTFEELGEQTSRVRTAVTMFIMVTALGCLSASAAPQSVWTAWLKDLNQQCPSKHVDWIAGDTYDELIGDFLKTEPRRTQIKATAIANYSHRCAQETIGFSCETSVYLDAFRKLGLLRRFTAFGCRTYTCTEQALCTKTSN